MKKYALLLFMTLLIPVSPAAAGACSGGYDGNQDFGCSEMGALGDLVYERDPATGMVMHKRSDEEIKQNLQKAVDERLGLRGVRLTDDKGSSNIVINDETITFDLFNQNGEKIYTYVIDKEKGVPQNEKPIIDSRKVYDDQKAQARARRLARIRKLQDLADKIKAEEAAAKERAAAR